MPVCYLVFLEVFAVCRSSVREGYGRIGQISHGLIGLDTVSQVRSINLDQLLVFRLHDVSNKHIVIQFDDFTS